MDDREKDRITADEFTKLEAKENKPSIIKKLFDKKKEVKTKKKEVLTPMTNEEVVYELNKIDKKFDDLLVKIEVQGGKLNMETEVRKTMNERMMNFASQLGELRSTLISKEHLFDHVEQEYEEVKELVKEFDTSRLDKHFSEVETLIVKNQAAIEKNISQVTRANEQIESFAKVMKKVKSYEDLLDTLQKLDKQFKAIEKTKTDIERMSVKVESLFVELNDKVKLVSQIDDRVATSENSLKRVTDQVERINEKAKSFVKKDEMKKVTKMLEVVKKDVFERDMKKLDKLEEKITQEPIEQKKPEPIINPVIKPEQQPLPPVQEKPQENPESLSSHVETQIDNHVDDQLRSLKPLRMFIKRMKDKGVELEPLRPQLLGIGWSNEEIDMCLQYE